MQHPHVHPTFRPILDDIRVSLNASPAVWRSAELIREIAAARAQQALEDSPAASQVDEAISRIGGGYDSEARRQAIRAVAEGHAAVLTTGRHYNHAAANCADDVNRGGGTVSDHAVRWAKERGVGAAERFVIEALFPLNEAGELQLEEARWELAGFAAAADATDESRGRTGHYLRRPALKAESI